MPRHSPPKELKTAASVLSHLRSGAEIVPGGFSGFWMQFPHTFSRTRIPIDVFREIEHLLVRVDGRKSRVEAIWRIK